MRRLYETARVDPAALRSRLAGVICSFDVDGQMLMVPGESVAKTLIAFLEPPPLIDLAQSG